MKPSSYNIDALAMRRGLLGDLEVYKERWRNADVDDPFTKGFWEGHVCHALSLIALLEKSIVIDKVLEATKDVVKLPTARVKEN